MNDESREAVPMTHVEAIRELMRRHQAEAEHYKQQQNHKTANQFRQEWRGLLMALDVVTGARVLYK